jgi:hypothetical protein
MRHISLAMAAAMLIGAAGSAPAQAPSESAPPPAETAPTPVPPTPPSEIAPTPSVPLTPPVPPARFTFNRVDGGFLRLDNETGQVAICSQRAVGWGCQAVPEDRAALEKEIARLQDESAKLKNDVTRQQDEAVKLSNEVARQQNQAAGLTNEVARLKDEVASLKIEIAILREPPPRPPAELTPPANKKDEPKITLPTREDIERARAALESAWRRIVDTIQNLQKDVMGKG